MPKINQKEYEVLKGLVDEWKWIARDKDNTLWVYTEMPVRKSESNVPYYWDTETEGPYSALELIDEIHLFHFIQWEDEEPHNIAELIEEYEDSKEYKDSLVIEYFLDKAKESEETEVKNIEELKSWFEDDKLYVGEYVKHKIDRLDELERHQITLQDVTDKLWELPLNNRKLWLARLNDEFQEGYIVPLGLKTTDGEEQYLTYNGSYFASRRNKYLQQTFDTLEEIPEFYRELAERVL